MTFLTIVGFLLYVIGIGMITSIHRALNMDIYNRPHVYNDPAIITFLRIISYMTSLGGIYLVYLSFPKVAIVLFIYWIYKKIRYVFFIKNKHEPFRSGYPKSESEIINISKKENYDFDRNFFDNHVRINDDNVKRINKLDKHIDIHHIKTIQSDNEETNIKTYYHKNGKIKEICEIAHGKKNGEYTEYYESGKIFSKGRYKDNLLDDEITNYFEKGNISMISHFRDGIQNGEMSLFYETGELQSKVKYIDNIPIQREVFSKDGKRVM